MNIFELFYDFDYYLVYALLPLFAMPLRKLPGKYGWLFILFGGAFFVIPLFFRYVFIFPDVHYWFFFISFGWLLSRIPVKGYSKKHLVIKNILLSAALGIGILINSLPYFNLGYTRLMGVIQFSGNYEVIQLKSKGFAGSHFLRIHELRHTVLCGSYSKKPGTMTVSSNDTTNQCLLHYASSNMTFDRCKKRLWTNN